MILEHLVQTFPLRMTCANFLHGKYLQYSTVHWHSDDFSMTILNVALKFRINFLASERWSPILFSHIWGSQNKSHYMVSPEHYLERSLCRGIWEMSLFQSAHWAIVETLTPSTQSTSLSDKAENTVIWPWCQPVLHLAKSDLAAPPCLAGHWVLYRCRIHKQSGIQGNKSFFSPALFNCLFNVKGHVARQRLWLEIKPSFSGLFIVKFSFCKVGQCKEMGFKVKWICAIQTWPTTSSI